MWRPASRSFGWRVLSDSPDIVLGRKVLKCAAPLAVWGDIAQPLVFFMLIPLGIALGVRWRYPESAALAPHLNQDGARAAGRHSAGNRPAQRLRCASDRTTSFAGDAEVFVMVMVGAALMIGVLLPLVAEFGRRVSVLEDVA